MNQITEPLSDGTLRNIADTGVLPNVPGHPPADDVKSIARELLDARARHIRALSLIHHLMRSRRRYQANAEYWHGYAGNMERNALANEQAWQIVSGKRAEATAWAAWFAAERDQARARIAELEAERGKVRDFINERTMYVDALKSDTAGGDDYHRWSGGAEARRQLAGRLGWTVPHEHGDKTSPIVGTGTGTRPAAVPQSDPAGYVVVTRNAEGGLHRPATVWPTLEQANTAEGIESEYEHRPGVTYAVYALQEVQQ
ncbi:hypothetical protein [Nocardia africana]